MAFSIHPRLCCSTVLMLLGSLLIANHTQAQHVNADASWHVGDDVVVPSDAAAIESAPIECNCGKNKCCPGVCRDPGHPAKPSMEKPGDVDRGDCPPYRYRICDCQRAGKPHCVAPWATCSVTEKYSAWFVGGGAAFGKGRPRKQSEGTWGMDYGGLFGRANVWLNYTRCREQGGEGAYETDGEPEFVRRAHELFHR